MKRIIAISLIVIIFVGGCTAILMMNRKKIEEKSKMDGNLESIPVYVAEVKKSALSGDFEVNGSFVPMHELTVMSECQGKVVELSVNTGDFVNRGRVIAKIDDVLVRSQLSLAEAALEKARADLRKFESLLRADAISGQQVEDLKLGVKKAETDVSTLKKQLEYATITAPIQGTVTKRMIESGSLLLPGSPVVEIVDVSRLKFIANLAETEIVRVKTGQEVVIQSSVYPGIVYQGVIAAVGVKADDSRRFPVEIEVANSAGSPLKAGMFGTAVFGSGMPRETIMVPRSALVGSIKTPKLYVVENNRSMLRDIRTGTANDKEVEVLGGIEVGEIIVTSGQINLDHNVSVRVLNNK